MARMHVLAHAKGMVLPGLLRDLQLEHGQVSVEGTPRRLSVMVHGLATRQQQVSLGTQESLPTA